MTKDAWVAQQRGRKAVLYVVQLWAGEESFYKVGITFDLSSRFSRLKESYRWRTVARYSSWSAARVFDLEQRLHKRFARFAYRPLIDFGGLTECYSSVDELLLALPKSTFFLKNTTTLI